MFDYKSLRIQGFSCWVHYYQNILQLLRSKSNRTTE